MQMFSCNAIVFEVLNIQTARKTPQKIVYRKLPMRFFFFFNESLTL